MRECLRVLGTEITHGEVKSVAVEKGKAPRGARLRVNNGATVQA